MIFLGLLLATATAVAGVITARVIWIDDGDSLGVRDAQGRIRHVRLLGIDAPERSQAYGNVSRRNLTRLARGRQVSVEYHQIDKYGRILGWLAVDGVSVNLAQVQAGLAWHYAFPGRPWTPNDDVLARAQQEARNARLGLWARPNPKPPWQYRREREQKGWKYPVPTTPPHTGGINCRDRCAIRNNDMKPRPTIFLSGVSHEFGTFRDAVEKEIEMTESICHES